MASWRSIGLQAALSVALAGAAGARASADPQAAAMVTSPANPAAATLPATGSATSTAQAPATSAASPVMLIVRAHGFHDANGSAVVALYDSSGSWLKIARSLRHVTLPIVAGAVEARFTGLLPGRYAVTVVHDVNGNGKLDMRWLPWPRPKEGTGVSNDAHGGPPRWRDARLDLYGDRAIDVTVSY